VLLSVGDPHDLTAVYVGWLAAQRGVEVLTLPEEQYGATWWINVDEPARDAHLVVSGAPIAAERVRGVFVRFNPDPGLPDGWELGGAARELFIQERRAAISEGIESLGVRAVNRPSAGRSNGAKPMHMARLSRYGFAVPEWIAGNDLALMRPFLSTCPDGAVVKASSGLRSHVRLADEDYLSRLTEGTTPSIVQRFVRGYEVRVHVVGRRVFGTRIDASSVDYRFDAEHVRYEREEVPEPIARLCVESAARDGLALAGLDFRVDRDGAWWCLEMNPVPTFLPYEASSGAAIGDAVLDYILDADGVTTTRSPLAALVQDTGA
jgi:hypothetical protein